MTDATLLLQLKVPASADTAELGRALSDFLDDVPLSTELARIIAPDTDESPFDGFTVVDGSELRVELDPLADPQPYLTAASAEALAPILERLLPLSDDAGNVWHTDDHGMVHVDPDDLKAVLAVVRIALANVDQGPEPTPLQALREDDGWLALLLALMVRTERYLQDIPMLGVSRRAAGREELLALLVPTIDRAEELANTVDPDGSVRGDLAAVVAQVLHPTDNTNQEG